MKTNRYSVQIQHPEWGHELFTFSSKKEALKEASYVRGHGSMWCDDLKKNERESSLIHVYDNILQKEIWVQPFTKKYCNYAH